MKKIKSATTSKQIKDGVGQALPPPLNYRFYFRIIMIKSDYYSVAVTMVISQVTKETVTRAQAGYLVLDLNLIKDLR